MFRNPGLLRELLDHVSCESGSTHRLHGTTLQSRGMNGLLIISAWRVQNERMIGDGH